MGVRGDITVECDTPTCNAELVIAAYDVTVCHFKWGLSLEYGASGWRETKGRYTCPQCAEEADAAR